MDNDKTATSSSLGPRSVSDRELLMQGHAEDVEDPLKAGPPPPSGYNAGREGDALSSELNSLQPNKPVSRLAESADRKLEANAFYAVIQSWASKKFMSGCVILFPIAITFYVTWWFIAFFDGFFKPVYKYLGISVFGVGFITSIIFIFLCGVFVSSWMGASVLWMGEWFIKRMPLVKHIYSASKQISAAISPDQNTHAFQEVAIIRHPRIGEYAIGFITSSLTLQMETGDEELCSVYVPTNHLYIGDIFLVNTREIIRPNLSVREGIEIVVSGGMSMPQMISPLSIGDRRVVPANGRAYDLKDDNSSHVKYTGFIG